MERFPHLLVEWCDGSLQGSPEWWWIPFLAPSSSVQL